MRTTDKNKTSIDAIAIYTDESKIGKSLYIDIDIDGYYMFLARLLSPLCGQ